MHSLLPPGSVNVGITYDQIISASTNITFAINTWSGSGVFADGFVPEDSYNVGVTAMAAGYVAAILPPANPALTNPSYHCITPIGSETECSLMPPPE